MPALGLQSRSSIDLGVSKPRISSSHKRAKFSAPRLQHSPSLPNIWIPPHSRPQMSSTAKEVTPTRPPTPFVSASKPPPNTPPIVLTKLHPNEMASKPEKSSLKGCELRRNLKTTHLYTRRRHRKDRDATQHLLTPPLTPSSSLRTTASADSTDETLEEKVQRLHELQEPEATHFLHLENVSRAVNRDFLQDAITSALAHLTPHRRSNPALPLDKKGAAPPGASCLKGSFRRHTTTSGTLFLAFYDVRDTIAAKAVLSQRTGGVLAECLGDEKLIDGTPAWFVCRFITADELVKTIGNSSFLATIDGGFLLSVTVGDNTDAGSAQTIRDDTKQAIELHTLVKTLESYGTLRLFKPESCSNEGQNFLVEFFDVRDADEAYTCLHGQVMWGMTMRTSGRLPSDLPEASDALETLSNKNQDRPDTPLSSHQSSASESHLPKLRPSIGPPGEASQMRGRFISETVRSRPRAVSVGNETTTSNSPRLCDHQPKTSSPTIFYSSFDLNDSFPSISSLTEDKTLGGQIAESNDAFPEIHQISIPREPQQACSAADCRYCPSRGQDSSTGSQPFNNHVGASFVQTLPFPVQSPPHLFVSPEFETPVVFPQPAAAWSFDPHIIPPATGNNFDLFTPTFIPTIPVVPVEHRFPEPNPNPNLIPNGLVFPAIAPALHVPPPPFVEAQPPVPLVHHNIFVTNEPGPQTDVDASLKLSTSGLSVNDRNFLNTARIEDGLDTRTTVMIKNIPNKMTAKDLIQYISEVCPRKIDFLYLRMDFKNGCNVGYAFVNFIRVQDMLKFAKKRLGVKWNLFSSEKVLQMSYANYQGKEALVEKFKNSCIMDERDEWRPKIFYSSGPEQGLPEPFPAPTHLRRKERSSHNRGALYVPGPPAHSGSSSGNGYLNNGSSRRQDYHSAAGARYLEHRTRSVDRGHREDSLGFGRQVRAHVDRSR